MHTQTPGSFPDPFTAQHPEPKQDAYVRWMQNMKVITTKRAHKDGRLDGIKK